MLRNFGLEGRQPRQCKALAPTAPRPCLPLLALCLAVVFGLCAPASADEGAERYKQANALRHSGRHSEAVLAFRRIRDDDEAAPNLRRKSAYLMGLCYENLDRTAEAIAAYEIVTERFPDSGTARNARRQIESLSGRDHRESLRLQLAAIKLHENGEHQASLRELERFELPDDPQDPAFQALLADPDSRRGDLYALRGDNLYALRRFDEAARAYDMADALNIPGAAELAERSRSYRYRAWIGRGAALALAMLLFLLARRAPWRLFRAGPRRRPALIAAGALALVWGALLSAFVVVGGRLHIQNDLARPIDGLALAVLYLAVSPAAFAGLLFALTSRRGISALLLSAVFAFAVFAASLICLLDRMDWFMLLGL